jgi:erythromycin esterase-like protein
MRCVVFGWLCAALLWCPSVFAAASPVDQAVALLCNKRVAVLGELPSHGEARAFVAKAAIVRGLVERCGFGAVLWESPIYDFVAMEADLKSGSATPLQFDNAIYKFWWAKELRDWRGWLFESAMAGRLRLGGIDDQLSITSAARSSLPARVAARLPADRADTCRAVVARNMQWSYDDEHPFDETEKRALSHCVRLAAAAPASRDSDEAFLIENLDGSIRRDIDAMDALDRDGAMYRNLLWYQKRWPQGTKIVVWTATVHASRRAGDLKAKPLGAWLADSQGDSFGNIGFTALAGNSSMAGHPIKPLPALPAGSLEARALGRSSSEVFLDARALRELGGTQSRLYGTPGTGDWATRFDGVIVFREEIPASFEPLATGASTASPP